MLGTITETTKARHCGAASIVALLTACLVLLIGCSNAERDATRDVTEPEASLYDAPISPYAVLGNLRVAIGQRDFDAYADLFDHDAFRYKVVKAVPFADDTTLFEWDWTAESRLMRGLFEDELERIDLEFTLSSPVAPDPNEIDGVPEASTLIWTTSFTLVLTKDSPSLGEQDIFIFDSGRADFFLREYPEEPIDGKPTWKIVEWRDAGPFWAEYKLRYDIG